jgi:GT2 family glycosyltransferase
MIFSIIIINYKTPQLTINCVKSILSLPNPENKEIIIIDNASKDGSVEKLEKEFGNKIKLIKNKINLGFSGANNQGAAFAKGNFILFLNSDTIVNKDIFSSCVDIFKNDKKVGIISPRLKLPNGENQKKVFGKFPTLIRLITQRTKKDPKINYNNKIYETDWVSGCALMIRQKLFKNIKGWDDNYFLYYEDIDLCKKVKEKNYKIIVNLKTNLIHLNGQSLKIDSKKKEIYYKSQNYYFRKHNGIIIEYLIKIFRYFGLFLKKLI